MLLKQLLRPMAICCIVVVKVLESGTASCSEVCQLHKKIQEGRLQDLKQRILDALELKEPPNVTGIRMPHSSLIKAIINEHKAMGDDPHDTKKGANNVPKSALKASVEKFYVFPSIHPKAKSETPMDSKHIYFNLAQLHAMKDYTVQNATLFIFLRVPTTHVQESAYTFTLTVYRYTSLTEIASEPLDSRSLRLALRPNGKYVSLDIADLVRKWADNPKQNFGLMIKAEHKGESLVDMSHSLEKGDATFMEIAVQQDHQEYLQDRMKPNDCKEADYSHATCCRYPLEVDFQAIGWDWILVPRSYRAYYCAGACPLSHTPLHSRAYFIQQMSLNIDADLGICCAPVHMIGLSMIYFTTEREIISRVIPDMVVELCSCN